MDDWETAHAGASGNIDGDPGFVSSSDFSPDTGSAMIGAGVTLSGAPYSNGGPGGTAIPLYNEVIDPDQTDFTTTPPTVVTEAQPSSWYIGAYGETGDVAPTLPIQGAAGNFKYN